jgi:hypothetical protein
MILQIKHVKFDFHKMIFQEFQIPIYKYQDSYLKIKCEHMRRHHKWDEIVTLEQDRILLNTELLYVYSDQSRKR